MLRPNSVELTSSKLDYWSPFVIENGVTRTHRLDVYPHTTTPNNGPTEFHINPDPEKFIDISNVTLQGKVSLRYKEGDALVIPPKDTSKDWTVVNNFFQSLFNSITIKINDCEIGDLSGNCYAYIAYLQKLLGTSASNSGCHIHAQQGFEKDANKRQAWFLEKEHVDFSIPLHNDLMTCEKYLPPNTKLSITLRRNDNAFLLVQDAGCKHSIGVGLKDLSLKVNMLEVSPEVLNHHQQKLNRGQTMRIRYTQNILKTFTVPKGSMKLQHHNLFFGAKLPNRVYMVFVEQEAYNGHLQKNPFQFDQANMCEASLVVNGQHEPSPPYRFIEGEHEKEYYFSFLENTGTSPFEMDSVNVSLEEFKKDCFIFALDRSPAGDNGTYAHKTTGGSMSINVVCKAALEKNYMVLVFGSYDSVLVFVDDKIITESIY